MCGDMQPENTDLAELALDPDVARLSAEPGRTVARRGRCLQSPSVGCDALPYAQDDVIEQVLERCLGHTQQLDAIQVVVVGCQRTPIPRADGELAAAGAEGDDLEVFNAHRQQCLLGEADRRTEPDLAVALLPIRLPGSIRAEFREQRGAPVFGFAYEIGQPLAGLLKEQALDVVESKWKFHVGPDEHAPDNRRIGQIRTGRSSPWWQAEWPDGLGWRMASGKSLHRSTAAGSFPAILDAFSVFFIAGRLLTRSG